MMKAEKSRSSVAAPERDTSAQNTFTGFEAQGDCSIFGVGLQGRLALKPREVAPLIGVGNNMIYTLCHRADFPAVKVGSGYIIPVEALQRWLTNQAEREVSGL